MPHRHDPAASQDADPIGGPHHLVELVGDEYDGKPLPRHLAERREEIIGLLRRQHRTRFVEDQDLRAIVERLQDLHPLLLAHRKVGDARPGVHREAEPCRKSFQPIPCPPPVRAPSPERLGPRHHVVEHGEVRGEREVLMHHPHPRRDRRARPTGRQHATPDPHLARIRGVMAEQDRHERRLARAVLPQERQDLAPVERQRHVLVRHHRAEPLGDARQLQHPRHAAAPSGIGCVQPPFSSVAAPRSRRSPPIGARSCTGSGRPSASAPTGTVSAGAPVTLARVA